MRTKNPPLHLKPQIVLQVVSGLRSLRPRKVVVGIHGRSTDANFVVHVGGRNTTRRSRECNDLPDANFLAGNYQKL